MWERTLTVDSIGKTFSVTGWKIGWAIAAARADRGHPRRAPVRHLRQRHALPGGGGRRARPTAAATGYYDELRADYDRAARAC